MFGINLSGEAALHAVDLAGGHAAADFHMHRADITLRAVGVQDQVIGAQDLAVLAEGMPNRREKLAVHPLAQHLVPRVPDHLNARLDDKPGDHRADIRLQAHGSEAENQRREQYRGGQERVAQRIRAGGDQRAGIDLFPHSGDIAP